MALSEFNKMRAQQRAVIAARLKAKAEAATKKTEGQNAEETPHKQPSETQNAMVAEEKPADNASQENDKQTDAEKLKKNKVGK